MKLTSSQNCSRNLKKFIKSSQIFHVHTKFAWRTKSLQIYELCSRSGNTRCRFTAICVQASSANIFASFFTFVTWHVWPFETETAILDAKPDGSVTAKVQMSCFDARFINFFIKHTNFVE